MISAARKSPPPNLNQSIAAAPGDAAGPTCVREFLAANINPRTRLATDYLNHFNEAIMLLELVPDMPECAEDFLQWRPLSYREHFMASHFTARDLAVSAYESADPAVRAEFDNITTAMTAILVAVGDAMRQARQDSTRAQLAGQAMGWVKPLVTLAGGIINGPGETADVDFIMTH